MLYNMSTQKMCDFYVLLIVRRIIIMKKIISILLAVLMLLAFASCEKAGEPVESGD